jgi:hypothetical protein
MILAAAGLGSGFFMSLMATRTFMLYIASMVDGLTSVMFAIAQVRLHTRM